MQLTDSREIAASPDVVWAAILDPAVLQACVPGCKEMSGTPDEGFDATVVQKVGPVKATFKGTVTLSDMVAPESLTLTGEGKGGAAGFAKGGAKLRITPSEAGATLHYEVEAKVGGKLAQLGSRIIDGFAKKMADQFFTTLQEQIEGPADPEAESAADATTGGGEEKDSHDNNGQDNNGEDKKGWFKKLVS